MQALFKKLFGKPDGNAINLPQEEHIKFYLKVDQINLGTLECENGEWKFQYTPEFISHSNEYNRLVGFSDLHKTYYSQSLWPFFQTRIPGLKQPAIQEIIKSEKIDQTNEAVLLKRFGQKTITNDYKLEPAF